MNKEVKKLFVVLALYALAGGMFYNFQELWLLNNSLSIKTISVIYSLCAILTISTLFLCSSIVRKEKLKSFTAGLLFVKFLIILSLFFLDKSNFLFLIKFLVIVDYVVDVEIYACIYPIISEINKSDKIYASRKITYDGMYFLGVLITCLLLGKSLSVINITYNSYLLISSIIFIIAFVVLLSVKTNNSGTDEKHVNYFDLVKKIKGDKITASYLLYGLFGNMAYYSLSGMTLIVLTEGLGYSSVKGSMLILILGLLSVVLGIIVMTKLTFKNDYINFTIKFLTRTLLFLLAFISNNKIFMLVAIIFLRLSVDSYEHISDAPYVNRFAVSEQFSFANLNDGFKYLGRALGTLICGAAIVISLRYNFLFAFIFGMFQVILGYIAIYLRKKEEYERNY